MSARKNYKRIRLARHLMAVLSKHYGEPVTVDPDDFGLPFGAWRTNVMLDVQRWDVNFRTASGGQGDIGSYSTLSECAQGGVALISPRGWFLECSAGWLPEHRAPALNGKGVVR